MQISYNTLVIIKDGKNLAEFIEFFNFNNLPTTTILTTKEFWSKVVKAYEYDFDYVLTIDASNELPQDFVELYTKINESSLVLGNRQGFSLVSKILNLAFGKWNFYKDWFSGIRLYRIESLLSLNKFDYSEDYETFLVDTLVKATRLGHAINEVELTDKIQPCKLSFNQILKLWYKIVITSEKIPTNHESDLY